jgi:hypothetical protein
MTVEEKKNRERPFLRHGVEGSAWSRAPMKSVPASRLVPLSPVLRRLDPPRACRQQVRRPMSRGRLSAYCETAGVRPPKETA